MPAAAPPPRSSSAAAVPPRSSSAAAQPPSAMSASLPPPPSVSAQAASYKRSRSETLRELLDKPNRTHQSLFEDRVFNEEMWQKHRNSLWRHRLEPILFLRVAVGFFWQLLIVMVVAVLTGLYVVLLVPIGAPEIPQQLFVSYTMLTFALSLLLVFKTNSSYSRWWEGRIVMGQLVNYSRNYARLILMHMPAHERRLCPIAIKWVAASLHVLRGHIRQMAPNAYLQASHLLDTDDLQYLSRWKNPCSGVGKALSSIVQRSSMNANLKVAIEDQVTLYINMCGACERIYKTPIPAAYTRHTSRFVMIYSTILPIILWPVAGWATIFLSVLIAFLLLGTENIGVQIEEPFHVLPMDAMCNGIEADVKELLREFDSIEGDPLGREGLQLPLPVERGQRGSDTPTAAETPAPLVLGSDNLTVHTVEIKLK